MAKRFTDSDKWKKRWFRKLNNNEKVFWMYLLDQCDHAGIWEVDFELASYFCGKFFPHQIMNTFSKQFIEFDNGKRWFIKDFIEFQYGRLNEKNRAHLSAIQRLKKFNLLKYLDGAYKPLISPLQGAKDKDKDKDKVKDKEKRGKKEQLADINIDALITEFESVDVSGEFKKWQDWMLSKGKTYKNYNAAFKNWLRSDYVKTKEGNGIKKIKLICPEHNDITVHTERGTVKYCVKCRHLMKSESELALIKIQDNV